MTDQKTRNIIVSTAYWPNLELFREILLADHIIIESKEHFIKQSFRNRCAIYGANGKLDLIIPLKREGKLTDEKKISYQENWQRIHWRAIYSAYKSSPFFDFFEDELKAMYSEEVEFLIDYNLKQLKLILKFLRIKKEIELSKEYGQVIKDHRDLRVAFSPKKDTDLIANNLNFRPYKQVFDHKSGFIPNLSILDLIFNKGLQSVQYLNNAN